MNVLSLRSLHDTTLWNTLQSGFEGTPHAALAARLAAHVETLAAEAAERMKAFPSLHPEYTLHDEAHLLRVTELMARVLTPPGVEALNPVEIALLILAAFFHDLGMVPSPGERDALASDSDFQMFREGWRADHPSLAETEAALRDPSATEADRARLRRVEAELQSALLTDYVRQTHGERSARIVAETYGADPRLEVAGRQVADLLAALCASHVRPARDLVSAQGFEVDESVGPYVVNMPFMGVVLRLADLLDFDRDRTPDALYRSIHFASPVSLAEWEKHRSVEGWVIEPTTVRFTARCDHPAYERAVRQYMDYIDEELSACHTLVRSFPGAAPRSLDLPTLTDRSRIGPKDQAYIYHDLEFSLSRDEVVRLLMTDRLYGSPSLCIRELLQNGLDAVRLRHALFRREPGAEWKAGAVRLEHLVGGDGREIVRCTDNGVGMDEHIVTQFLTRVGRSYYRSAEFERVRQGLKAVGADFDPCAQFGIGFMSCFMLGDEIRILTRRDHGPGEGFGDPLEVEISGLGGIIAIRPGPSDLPIGTTVEIVGRRLPDFFDAYEDRVRLVNTVEGLAIATEYPVEAVCSVPGIERRYDVGTEPAVFETVEAASGAAGVRTLEQPFSELDGRLRGAARLSVLEDPAGRIVLDNGEARYEMHDESGQRRPVFVAGETAHMLGVFCERGRVAFDGIFVCGRPGQRASDRLFPFTTHYGPVRSGAPSFTMDVRGTLKAPLTPARHPPEDHGLRPPAGWERLVALPHLAHGRLFEQLLAGVPSTVDPETLWVLAAVHNLWWSYVRLSALWDHLPVPVTAPDGDVSFRPLQALGTVRPVEVTGENGKPTLRYRLGDGATVGWDALDGWHEEGSVLWALHHVVLAASRASMDGGLVLRPSAASWDDMVPADTLLGSRFTVPTAPFDGELSGAFAVVGAQSVLNRDHALVGRALALGEATPETGVTALARGLANVLDIAKDLADVEPKSPWSVQRRAKWIGTRYQTARWDDGAADLRPPYRIVITDAPDVVITAAMLDAWAQLPTLQPPDD